MDFTFKTMSLSSTWLHENHTYTPPKDMAAAAGIGKRSLNWFVFEPRQPVLQDSTFPLSHGHYRGKAKHNGSSSFTSYWADGITYQPPARVRVKPKRESRSTDTLTPTMPRPCGDNTCPLITDTLLVKCKHTDYNED